MSSTFLKDIAVLKKAYIGYTVVILVLCIIIYVLFNRLNMVESQSAFLKRHTENLLLFTEDKGRILALERKMTDDKVIYGFLGDAVPRVAYKILSLSTQYRDDGITSALLLGVIQTESGFNPSAISRASDGRTPVAYGLMQITRETGTFLLEKDGYTWSPETIMHPETNLEMGTKYLVMLHRQFVSMGIELPNEYTMSLVAYNRGSRPIIEAFNGKNKGILVMSYYMKVRTASKRWSNEGF